MPLLGAVVLPHGALILDGNPDSESDECKQRNKQLPETVREQISNLYEGSCQAAAHVASLNPDIVILSTPHGFKLSESLAIYSSDKCEGTTEWAGHWTEFEVEVDIDASWTTLLVKHLRDMGVSAEELMSFGGVPSKGYKPFPLAWGETIPAYFLNKYLKKDVKYLIMSHPRKPGTETQALLDIGLALSTFIDQHLQDYKVVLAVSGDLSHCYQPQYLEQPLYLPIPIVQDNIKPKHTEAVLFEQAVRGWVLAVSDNSSRQRTSEFPSLESGDVLWTPTSALPWLQLAAELQSLALSCGLSGFSVLHGVMDHMTGKGETVSTRILAVKAPTYYGMMVAVFDISKITDL